jgi:pimeloyl-ACP methyl ester carboxylesterase
MQEMGLQNVTLVGHDIGGMVVYVYLHAYPGELHRAVIMNVAVPGIDPWSEVTRNPHIWHFAFHAVPELSEQLVVGHQAAYFAFFYDALSAIPGAVDKQARKAFVEAYSSPRRCTLGLNGTAPLHRMSRTTFGSKTNVCRLPCCIYEVSMTRANWNIPSGVCVQAGCAMSKGC